MGEMTTDERIGEAVDQLRRSNRSASMAHLVAYATAWIEYEDADVNIRENGTIVYHPKTGAPINNPYMGIRDGAERRMTKIRGINADVLWVRRSGA